jgi:hypothetical protein
VSATTPVGTSKAKMASSIAVPASTSWSGFSPTSRTKYTAATVNDTAQARLSQSSLA